MIKVKVRNSTTDTNYESHLMTDAEADQWISERLTKGSWGASEDLAIVKKDMTADIDAEISKKERLSALKDKHAAMRPQDLDTLIEIRQALFEIQEFLGIR